MLNNFQIKIKIGQNLNKTMVFSIFVAYIIKLYIFG